MSAGTAAAWVHLGHGPLSAAALAACAQASPPAAVLTGRSIRRHNPVVDVARSLGVPVHVSARVGEDTEALRLLADATVAVCCGWSEQIAGVALAAPRDGWLNLHPSRLPHWRGADPIAWQLVTRSSELGGTVHRMTAGFDDGPILARGAVVVREGDTHGSAMIRVGALLGTLARDVLSRILADLPVTEDAQPDGDATWCPPLGVSVVLHPERLTTHQVARMLRAFSPWPGVLVDGLDAGRAVEPGRPWPLAAVDRPGTVLCHGDDRVVIACRDGWLEARLCV